MPDKKKKTRVTIDLNEAAYRRLEFLEETLDVSSKADVIRDALKLYDFCIGKVKAGGSVQVTLNGETTPSTLVFPI